MTRSRAACRRQRHDLADEGAEGPAELGRAAQRVALPERQLPRLPGRGGDEHPVVGDVLDAPGRRAEREDVADPRLVDHLLVELADPAARALAGGEEDGVQAAVGDRAAAGDGEALGAAAAGEGVGHAVPHDARPQLGELVARVAPGEHVERRVEHRAGSEARGAVRRTSATTSSTVHSSIAHIATICWASTSSGLVGDAQRLDLRPRACARRRRRSARGRRGTSGT